MIDYCYHTHTYRCGHAIGKEEEYVIAAIQKGIKVLGFTDHVFLPDLEQNGMRGSFMELDDYIYTIKGLQRKYADKIEIHLGFECEFGEQYEDYYHYLKEIKGIEYLILGQHLFFEGEDLVWLSRYGTPEEMLEHYVEVLISAMKTGLFTYIAHPDMCLRFFKKITPFVEAHIRKICEAAEYYEIPLEINMGGMRNCRRDPTSEYLKYPCEEFFKIASEYRCQFIVGLDSHNPADFSTSDNDFAYAEEILNKYNLRHITRLNIK